MAPFPPEVRTDGSAVSWLVEQVEAGAVTAPAVGREREVVPQKAYDLLLQLQARHGEPLPGYVGGRQFQNREHRLPPGRYREYDVYPKIRGHSRGSERIVIEQGSGKAYYSGDHYRTFTLLNEAS